MELNEIDGVREWMKAKYPTEWQTERIPEDMTFAWLKANLRNREEWERKLDGLDTAPREAVLVETVRRMAADLRDAGIVRQAVIDAVMETPGWR